MASSLNAVRAAIEGRIKAQWTTTRIQWQGVPFDPTDDPYVRVVILWPENTEMVSMGSNRIHALLSIDFFDRPGAGYGRLYGYADAFRDIVNRVTLGAIQFDAAGPPREIPDPEAAWLMLNVTTPFQVGETV